MFAIDHFGNEREMKLLNTSCEVKQFPARAANHWILAIIASET
jgi:hypothetical protein